MRNLPVPPAPARAIFCAIQAPQIPIPSGVNPKSENGKLGHLFVPHTRGSPHSPGRVFLLERVNRTATWGVEVFSSPNPGKVKYDLMAFHSGKPAPTPQERAARRKLILSDTVSLAVILVITALLAVAAHFIYQSYASHRRALALRWSRRGAEALTRQKPLAAIGALRSALALNPSDTDVEIQLAEALAAAGRTDEATSYFKTLAETRPGDGLINLHLARLAASQGDEQHALRYYQRAIFGDWQGDGYLRRRQVRLEMIRYLISHGLDLRARSELLISAGNAPRGDSRFLIEVAATMEQAHDPENALQLYQHALGIDPKSVPAMQGAGRAAFSLRQYQLADRYLTRVTNASEGAPGEAPAAARSLLTRTRAILKLDPFSDISARERAVRVLRNRKTAQARLAQCATRLQSSQAPSEKNGKAVKGEKAPASPPPSLLRHPLQNLESHFKGSSTAEAAAEPPSPAEGSLASLEARWNEQPGRLTIWRLERDQNLVQSEMQLVFDTERITAHLCGAPSGDDALLLEMAGPVTSHDD